VGLLRDLARPGYLALALAIHGKCSVRSSTEGSFHPGWWLALALPARFQGAWGAHGLPGSQGSLSNAAPLVESWLPMNPQLSLSYCLGCGRAENATIEVCGVLLIT